MKRVASCEKSVPHCQKGSLRYIQGQNGWIDGTFSILRCAILGLGTLLWGWEGPALTAEGGRGHGRKQQVMFFLNM